MRTVMIVLALLIPSAARADEQAMIAGMQRIAAAWAALIDRGQTFLQGCGEGWNLARLQQRGEVSFDVRRTSSVVNTYVGIVRFNAQPQTNAEPKYSDYKRSEFTRKAGNGYICYKQKDTAGRQTDDKSWHLHWRASDMTFQYHIRDGAWVLAGPDWAVRNLAAADNLPAWSTVIAARIDR